MLWEAGDDVIAVSWFTWLITIATFVGTYAVYFLASKKLWSNIKAPIYTRFKTPYLALFFVCLLTSNILHLVADAEYDQKVTSLVRHVPLFSPATAKMALLNGGWVDEADIHANRQKMTHESGSQVNYPHSKLESSVAANPNL